MLGCLHFPLQRRRKTFSSAELGEVSGRPEKQDPLARNVSPLGEFQKVSEKRGPLARKCFSPSFPKFWGQTEKQDPLEHNCFSPSFPKFWGQEKKDPLPCNCCSLSFLKFWGPEKQYPLARKCGGGVFRACGVWAVGAVGCSDPPGQRRKQHYSMFAHPYFPVHNHVWGVRLGVLLTQRRGFEGSTTWPGLHPRVHNRARPIWTGQILYKPAARELFSRSEPRLRCAWLAELQNQRFFHPTALGPGNQTQYQPHQVKKTIQCPQVQSRLSLYLGSVEELLVQPSSV